MTFRVVFTRDGRNWTVAAPDVHPAHSWGPNIESAAEHIKEAIALVLDLPAGAESLIDLDSSFQIDTGDQDEVFRMARESRLALQAAQASADEALREAIQVARRANISNRDIAVMTGVSHQRVAQIVAGR